eukprot:Skav216792  [mRNA]  locus=scaffold1384:192006:196893:+ [translate_table: standard]
MRPGKARTCQYTKAFDDRFGSLRDQGDRGLMTVEGLHTLSVDPTPSFSSSRWRLPEVRGVVDIRVGETLQIYGRSIFVTDCDPFTREYFEQIGAPQGAPEPEELDPFQETRQAMKLGWERGSLGSWLPLFQAPNGVTISIAYTTDINLS